MNVRSCQLCGKPLSRLRVGGDGDFCSREHRNQHRLAPRMDRLEEANKVTSLMRRRENPRHISAARLMCNSALERRGFLGTEAARAQDRHRRLFAGVARSGRAARRQRTGPVCAAAGFAPARDRRLPAGGYFADAHRRPGHAALGSASPPEAAGQDFPGAAGFAALRDAGATDGAARLRNAAPGQNSRSPGRRQPGAGCAPTAACAGFGPPNPSAQYQILCSGRQCAAGFDWDGVPRCGGELARFLQPAAGAGRAGVAAHSAPGSAGKPRFHGREPQPGNRNPEVPRAPARGRQPGASRPIRLSGKPGAAPPAAGHRRPAGQAHHGCLVEALGAAFQGYGGAATVRRDLPSATELIFSPLSCCHRVRVPCGKSRSRHLSRGSPWAARRSRSKAWQPRPSPVPR